ncbi:MAG: diaminopimelate epimerase [Oceanococcus sp.]
MLLKFTKMQALGNDFVVLDGVRQSLQLDAQLCRRLGDRRLGVGCDQILVVDPSPADGVDFGYRIYNCDGSEVGQCGNGARALARFVQRAGLSQAQQLTVATSSTRMNLSVLDDDWVRVELAHPEFAPATIPLLREQPAERYALSSPWGDISGGAVSVGNPHFVIEVDDVDAAPVQQWGAHFTTHPDFPEGVNVGFVQRVSATQLRLRVFERGVGETPACGSGACAAAVIMRLWGRAESLVNVDLPGGQLRISWDEGQNVLMEGPAQWVFEGEIEL